MDSYILDKNKQLLYDRDKLSPFSQEFKDEVSRLISLGVNFHQVCEVKGVTDDDKNSLLNDKEWVQSTRELVFKETNVGLSIDSLYSDIEESCLIMLQIRLPNMVETKEILDTLRAMSAGSRSREIASMKLPNNNEYTRKTSPDSHFSVNSIDDDDDDIIELNISDSDVIRLVGDKDTKKKPKKPKKTKKPIVMEKNNKGQVVSVQGRQLTTISRKSLNIIVEEEKSEIEKQQRPDTPANWD